MMTKRQEVFDVVIVGATPAGGAAAIRARQAGLSCLVIEPEAWPRRQTNLDWLGPRGIEFCRSCGLDGPAVGAVEFTGVCLRSWDLSRETRVEEQGLGGWIVDRAEFDGALIDRAVAAGAVLRPEAQPQGLSLGEEYAKLLLGDGAEIRGRILLIGDGLNSRVAALARLMTAGESEGVAAAVTADFEGTDAAPQLDVIIGARRSPQTVTILRSGRRGRVVLLTRELSPAPQEQFGEFVEAARSAGLLPADGWRQVAVAASPAGVALEMETLIGKRCLQIGETGGFVAAFSNEVLYPEMQSGWLAAETAERALRAAVLQDELQSFSVAWRAELAEYLRLPNTDLALLMPLVFNNAQMSARVARAFLLGQGF